MDAQPILQYDVAYPERLSRGLIFVKWLLVFPHLFVLAFLQYAFLMVTATAWWIILFTGRYPRSIWAFSLSFLRWQSRLSAYIFLQRDEFPPMEDMDYPVLFHLDYPVRLSNGLVLIKWLLIIPHAIVLWILALIAGIVWILAWFAILFTGKYPRALFDFMTGYTRWSYRVAAYLLMLTDAYPPFTMDQVPSPTAPPAIPGGYQPIPPQAW